MKPEEWEKMSKDERKLCAQKLYESERGFYIMAQALVMAIEHMNEVPEKFREKSNIQDMEMLKECIFIFPVLNRTETHALNKEMAEVMDKEGYEQWIDPSSGVVGYRKKEV